MAFYDTQEAALAAGYRPCKRCIKEIQVDKDDFLRSKRFFSLEV